jgi:outer membrane protein, heavy metal efflux system
MLIYLPYSHWRTIFGNDDLKLAHKKISLEEALAIAIENNPELQATRDQVDAAIGLLRQSGLYPNPVLEFLVEEMPTREIGFHQSQNLVAITQPIILGGKRGLGIKINEKLKEKDILESEAALLTIIADTKKAFYKTLADQEGLDIAKNIEEITHETYKNEQVRFEAGEVPVTNVLRAEVELSMARNSVFNVEGKFQNSLKELLNVMGIPEEAIAGVAGRLLTRPKKLLLHELEEKMKNNQPLLKASRKNIEIAETQLALEKRQVIPDINVSAGYKRLSLENIDTIQMGIEIPTPFFNRNQGNIQKGKALSRKAKNENVLVYNNLLFQLKTNFHSYQVKQKQVIEYKDRILPKADESLTLITEGYNEGEFSYMDLLDTKRMWAETRISYIESLKDLNLILADIERLAVTKIGEQYQGTR